ncbi:GH92 family glycosyl hydrolase [Luteolibacter pohnpeiensis]|uniref:GH92 family glycosyl hydrolase n=1 Tax=Luteolibacter pohnpeiensis TaxID=454153 RepID=A0A934S926_9BACT|nr:GH92 family glycosyl hydrolase [Luteolibacter pohnpeiensis]MBK1884053.1 GH92 family glycosyl hydrolase [Luteolibacter pohnpeiensis]
MKYVLLSMLLLPGSLAFAQSKPPALVDLANPLQGTDSTGGFSHGNTFPAIALPFPMNVWAPYTQPAKDRFYYQYRQNKIRGIRQTHQPSPWIGDYANFSLMPVFGKLAVNEEDRASDFRHETEIATPAYYSVHLDTPKATAEVTPTVRAASFRFTFEQSGEGYIVVDPFDGGPEIKISPDQRTVTGICRNNHGGVPDNFANHFVIVFDQPFTAYGTWDDFSTKAGETEISGGHCGGYLKFDVKAGEPITCKVASSFISLDQAKLNLKREIGDADFDTVKQKADATWNETFAKIKVEGGTEEEQRTFYSAFYRSVIFPHRFYELDSDETTIYQSPFDGKLHKGYLYTDTGLWDTFRASHPLYNLLFPEISTEIMQSMVAVYDQSGWLPAWSSPGHRDCMIGNHSFSLFADAWVKGIRTFDVKTAMDAMVHDANTQSPENNKSLGRDGAAFYQKSGYVPYPEYREATAKTLEFAYDDFCAAVLAKGLGRTDDMNEFAKDALNYKNVFDPEVGFVRGRKSDGTWRENFDPTEWGGPFTEGNPWQWTWSVFHDIPGLIDLLGGKDAFTKKLDGVFYTPPDVNVGTYGGMIHEMTEMVAANMGQYAHGNQPVQHMIYLYDYAGQPWKAQARAREIMTRLYQSTPDGFCGDEDTGQMSAWFVFNAMGFYPMCPGTTQYMIGSPLFDRITLSLPGDKKFVIDAKANGPQRPYIGSATLNGGSFNRTFLDHSEITKGGNVTFEMTSAPNYKWGTAEDSRPGSALEDLKK